MDDTSDDLRAQLTDIRLHTQADVQRMWDLLMRPLGFASTSLWMCLVDEREAPVPHLMEIGGDDRTPGAREVDGLVEGLRELLPHLGDVSGVAFLLTRPGRNGLTDADRVLAGQLLAGARELGLTCHPVHVADDVDLVVVAPDDLAA